MAPGAIVSRIVTPSVIALASCTTYVQPIQCEGGEYRCHPMEDVKFCEYVALAVDGADCSEVGIAPSHHFCIVTKTKCVETKYAVTERDCRVVRYEPVREFRECSPGTPSFAAP